MVATNEAYEAAALVRWAWCPSSPKKASTGAAHTSATNAWKPCLLQALGRRIGRAAMPRTSAANGRRVQKGKKSVMRSASLVAFMAPKFDPYVIRDRRCEYFVADHPMKWR